jgi:hypothetical protein
MQEDGIMLQVNYFPIHIPSYTSDDIMLQVNYFPIHIPSPSGNGSNWSESF